MDLGRTAVVLLLLLVGGGMPQAQAHDRSGIEGSMRAAMPANATCSGGRDPATCDFSEGTIDYRIEYTESDGPAVTANLRFKQADESRRYLALLVEFLASFEFSSDQVRSCMAEAVEATARGFMGRAEIANAKYQLVCDFFRPGNAKIGRASCRERV